MTLRQVAPINFQSSTCATHLQDQLLNQLYVEVRREWDVAASLLYYLFGSIYALLRYLNRITALRPHQPLLEGSIKFKIFVPVRNHI